MHPIIRPPLVARVRELIHRKTFWNFQCKLQHFRVLLVNQTPVGAYVVSLCGIWCVQPHWKPAIWQPYTCWQLTGVFVSVARQSTVGSRLNFNAKFCYSSGLWPLAAEIYEPAFNAHFKINRSIQPYRQTFMNKLLVVARNICSFKRHWK
jgi:hypothetical protein